MLQRSTVCRSVIMKEEWITGVDERHGNPPQGNQEPLVVKGKVGRPPGEPGMSRSVECNTFPRQCFDTVGWATGRASGL